MAKRVLICFQYSRNMGFPVGSVVKNLLANAGATGDVGSIPGLGISLGREWQPTSAFLLG